MPWRLEFNPEHLVSPTYGPDTLDRAPSSRPPGLCLRRAHPDSAPYPRGAPTSVSVSSAGSTRYYYLGGIGVGAAQLSAFVELVALTVVLRLRRESLSIACTPWHWQKCSWRPALRVLRSG